MQHNKPFVLQPYLEAVHFLHWRWTLRHTEKTRSINTFMDKCHLNIEGLLCTFCMSLYIRKRLCDLGVIYIYATQQTLCPSAIFGFGMLFLWELSSAVCCKKKKQQKYHHFYTYYVTWA